MAKTTHLAPVISMVTHQPVKPNEPTEELRLGFFEYQDAVEARESGNRVALQLHLKAASNHFNSVVAAMADPLQSGLIPEGLKAKRDVILGLIRSVSDLMDTFDSGVVVDNTLPSCARRERPDRYHGIALDIDGSTISPLRAKNSQTGADLFLLRI